MLVQFSEYYRVPILVLHGFIGAVGVGSAATLDLLFFSFLKDRVIQKHESKVARTVSPLFMYALVGLYVTGFFLFLSDIPRYIESAKFLTKIVVVCVLTINGFILHHYITPKLHLLSLNSRTEPRKRLLRLAFACGAISLPSWIIAFVLGSVNHLPVQLWMLLLLYMLIVCGGVIISNIVLERMVK